MDWRVFITTFGLVFLAELGDKTQLATITMAVKSQSPMAVFWGALLALATVTFIGVAFGEMLTSLIPTAYIKKAIGALFVIIGILVLFGHSQ